MIWDVDLFYTIQWSMQLNLRPFLISSTLEAAHSRYRLGGPGQHSPAIGESTAAVLPDPGYFCSSFGIWGIVLGAVCHFKSLLGWSVGALFLSSRGLTGGSPNAAVRGHNPLGRSRPFIIPLLLCSSALI